MTSVLLADLFPEREPWTPPGYYVSTDAYVLTACGHCGAPAGEHTGPHDYCPRAPRECCTVASA